MSQVAPVQPAQASSDRLAVWREFDVANPSFFSTLNLARDGGYSEVACLFEGTRFFWAAFSIGCLIMNLFFIIYPNIDNLLSMRLSEWTATAEEEKFLVLNSIVGLLFGDDRRLQSELWLAFLELGLLIFYLGKVAQSVFLATRSRREPRWHGIASILWDDLPELSTFSAMKSLHYVTPKVLLPAFMTKVRRTINRGGSKYGLPLLTFGASRVFFAFVGFEAFVIKFQTAARSSLEAGSFLTAFFAAAAFLNQMLGVVDVNKFAHRRLFIFIFAGEDSFLSDREEMVSLTWRAMLAEKCWRASSGRGFRLLWFLAVTLSYGDDDFQKLTLNRCPRCHDPEFGTSRGKLEGSTAGAELKAQAAWQEPSDGG